MCEQGTFVARTGKNGPFWACSNYPNCKETRPDNDGQPSEKPQDDAPTTECPDCGGTRKRRESKKKAGVYFWTCSNRECPLRGDEDGELGESFQPNSSKKKNSSNKSASKKKTSAKKTRSKAKAKTRT